MIEIRSYNLKPGTRPEFHRLIRSYASLEDRQQSQDAFYGSDEWKQRLREAIVGLIESYTSVVEVDEGTLTGLRQ